MKCWRLKIKFPRRGARALFSRLKTFLGYHQIDTTRFREALDLDIHVTSNILMKVLPCLLLLLFNQRL